MEYVELKIFLQKKAIFDAGLFCKTFYPFQSASSPKAAGSFSI
jgi:hypothetical protein